MAGCVEPVDDISAASGVSIERGMLGNLHTWSDQFVESEDGLRVGAVGTSINGKLELHLLDLASGTSRSVPIAHVDWLAGVLSSGEFVGSYFENNNLHVELVDPLSGTATPVGSISGVASWGGQSALDRAKNRWYALAGSNRLYSLDLSNGSSSSLPLPWDGFLGGVTSTGQIVAAGSDGSGWVVSVIDPLTASVIKKGMLGDLSAAASLVYDPALGIAHTVGMSAQGVTSLYSLDLASGVSTQVPLKRSYILAKQ